MADELEEIKRKVDIVEFIGEYVPLKKVGRNFKALCPFHSEKTPSFIVSPERQIWHCFGACLPSRSLIKTERDYQPIEKVQIGQRVLTHKGRFMPVIRKLRRFYNGEIVDIKVRKSNEVVSLTDNHKVYAIRSKNCKQKNRRTRICQKRCQQNCPTKYFKDYKIEKIKAGEISLNDYLLFPIDENMKEVKVLNLNGYLTRNISFYARRLKKFPKLIKANKEFLQLIGYWIAEGSTDNYGHIRFTLGDHEENFAFDIVRLINHVFSLNSSLRRKTIQKNNSTGLEVVVNSSNLANIFENLCGKGAINKHIPFKFQNLFLKKQRIILEAVFRGDGTYSKVAKTKNKRFFRSITTISPILTEQLRDILLRLDIIPTITVTKGRTDKKGVSHKDSYTVSWQENIKQNYADIYRKNGVSYAVFPVKGIRKRKFKGKVYNLTVAEDHSYTTKNFVVANCGEGGDIFGFLMKMEGLEFGEALRILAKRVGIKLTRYQPSESERQKQRLYEINHLAAEYYHYVLLDHSAGKNALAYIQGRGINKDSLKRFQIGFAPNMWEGLQKFLVDKKGYSSQDLERAGLVIKGRRGFYDRFRARIMFPLKDHRGNLCGFAGRVLAPEVKEAKYVNTPETLVYHKSNLLYGLDETNQEIKNKDEAVLVEGELDAISSYQAGVKNVVAIKGSALTLNQVQLLGRFTQNITFALDADIAGSQAARRGVEVADAGGMSIKVVAIKGGKDPDEVAQKDPLRWRKMVLEAVPVYDYLLDSAFARFDNQTAEGKRRIGQEMVPVLTKITDKIVQSHYVRLLVERLDVDEGAVVAEIEKIATSQESRSTEEKVLAGEEKSRREILEEHLLGICFQSANWPLLRKRKIISLVKTPRFARVLETLGQYLKRSKSLKSKRFVKMLAPELLATFNQLYLLDLNDLVKDKEKFERELVKAIQQLAELDLKEKLKEITAKIKALERKVRLTKKELTTLDELNYKFSQLSQKLKMV